MAKGEWEVMCKLNDHNISVGRVKNLTAWEVGGIFSGLAVEAVLDVIKKLLVKRANCLAIIP